MIRPTFFGIEIGKSGLTLSQLGMDVTGHNIANVETAGYTRQRVVQEAYDPFYQIGKALPVDQAHVGHGVKVKILDQIRSAYLDRRFRTENTENAYWQKRVENLNYVQSYFDNVNEKTSISYSLAAFFGAIKVLAEDTVEGAPRTLLQTAGRDLTQQLNSIYEGLVDLQEMQNQAVKITVDDISRIAAEISELNKNIYGFELTGHLANDLRDRRNLLVDQLSALVDIEYSEYSDGQGYKLFQVTIGREILVDHDYYARVGVRPVENPLGEDEEPVWIPVWVEDRVDFGGGVLAVNGNNIKREVKQINDLATLIDRLNRQIINAPVGGAADLIARRDALISDLRAVFEDDIVIVADDPDNPDGVIISLLVSDDDTEGVVLLDAGGIRNRATVGDEPLLDAEGEPKDLVFTNGELQAYVDVRDSYDARIPGIPYYIEMLNNLARALVLEVNAVHMMGWTDPPEGGSINGVKFFEDFGEDGDWLEVFDDEGELIGFEFVGDIRNITAKNIRLSDAVDQSAFNIACSTKRIVKAGDPDDPDPDQLQRGNNENMNALYALFLKKDISIGDDLTGRVGIGSFDGYATSIRFDLGNTLSFAKKTADNSQTLTLAAENQRISISGVSLDEEMTNLIKYNHAYNGAARVITAMDDALDRLINGTGRVGL